MAGCGGLSCSLPPRHARCPLQSAPVDAAPPPDGRTPRRRRAACQPAVLWGALVAALALATAGVSAWGMAESLYATNSVFSELWGIFDDVAARVRWAPWGAERGRGSPPAHQNNPSASQPRCSLACLLPPFVAQVTNATVGFQDLDRELRPLYNSSAILAEKAEGMISAVASVNATLPGGLTLSELQVSGGAVRGGGSAARQQCVTAQCRCAACLPTPPAPAPASWLSRSRWRTRCTCCPSR